MLPYQGSNYKSPENSSPRVITRNSRKLSSNTGLTTSYNCNNGEIDKTVQIMNSKLPKIDQQIADKASCVSPRISVGQSSLGAFDNRLRTNHVASQHHLVNPPTTPMDAYQPYPGDEDADDDENDYFDDFGAQPNSAGLKRFQRGGGTLHIAGVGTNVGGYVQSDTHKRFRVTGRRKGNLRSNISGPMSNNKEGILNKLREPPSMSLVTSMSQSPGVWVNNGASTQPHWFDRSQVEARTDLQTSQFIPDTLLHRRLASCTSKTGHHFIGYDSINNGGVQDQQGLLSLSDEDKYPSDDDIFKNSDDNVNIKQNIRYNNDVGDFSVGNASGLDTSWNVLNLIQGLGTLGLPYALAMSGWAGLICLFVVSILGRESSNYLGDCIFMRIVPTKIEVEKEIEDDQLLLTENIKYLQYNQIVQHKNRRESAKSKLRQLQLEKRQFKYERLHSYKQNATTENTDAKGNRHRSIGLLMPEDDIVEVDEEELERTQTTNSSTSVHGSKKKSKKAEKDEKSSLLIDYEDYKEVIPSGSKIGTKQTGAHKDVDDEEVFDCNETEERNGVCHDDVIVSSTYACLGRLTWPRFGALFVSICVVVELFSALSLYYTLIGNSGIQLLHFFFPSTANLDQATLTVICGYSSSAMLFSRNMRFIAWSSLFAMVFQCITLVLIISFCIAEVAYRSLDHIGNATTVHETFHFDNFLNPHSEKIPGALGIIIFSFCLQGIIPGIKTNMKKPQNFSTIVTVCFHTCVVMKLLLGLLPAFLFGTKTSQSISENMINSPVFLVLTNIALCSNAFFSLPILAFAVSQLLDVQAMPLMNVTEPLTWKIEWKQNDIVYYSWIFFSRMTLVSAVLFFSIAVPEFSLLMGVIGVATGSLICFILPSLINLKLLGWRLTKIQKATRYLILGFGILISTGGSYFATADLVRVIIQKSK